MQQPSSQPQTPFLSKSSYLGIFCDRHTRPIKTNLLCVIQISSSRKSARTPPKLPSEHAVAHLQDLHPPNHRVLCPFLIITTNQFTCISRLDNCTLKKILKLPFHHPTVRFHQLGDIQPIRERLIHLAVRTANNPHLLLSVSFLTRGTGIAPDISNVPRKNTSTVSYLRTVPVPFMGRRSPLQLENYGSISLLSPFYHELCSRKY